MKKDVSQKTSQTQLHGSLKCTRCIAKSKEHSGVFVEAIAGDKFCFGTVLRAYSNLAGLRWRKWLLLQKQPDIPPSLTAAKHPSWWSHLGAHSPHTSVHHHLFTNDNHRWGPFWGRWYDDSRFQHVFNMLFILPLEPQLCLSDQLAYRSGIPSIYFMSSGEEVTKVSFFFCKERLVFQEELNQPCRCSCKSRWLFCTLATEGVVYIYLI